MKRCSKCKIEKIESEFYADKRTPSGLKAQCKTCHLESTVRTRSKENHRDYNQRFMEKSRKDNPEKFREREKSQGLKRKKDERYRARYILNGAVRAGKIIKPPECSSCHMDKKLTAHHPDYSKPLNVKWLCYKCHAKEHRHDQ